ncbi:hypothetical protein KA183_10660 [bacterium]|nr:hypothetical protein [bacterium]QQR57482.1 MAG: hypothetical protein IPG59_21285 [Candidatus Melainabacteria bacterium]
MKFATYKISLRTKLLIGLVPLLAGFIAPNTPVTGAPEQMSRAEKMLMNLRLGQGSATFYLLEAARQSKDVEKNLRKALFQIKEVDKAYAKSKGKPDSKYLEAITVKLNSCQEKSVDVSRSIEDSVGDLKEQINDALLR